MAKFVISAKKMQVLKSELDSALWGWGMPDAQCTLNPCVCSCCSSDFVSEVPWTQQPVPHPQCPPAPGPCCALLCSLLAAVSMGAKAGSSPRGLACCIRHCVLLCSCTSMDRTGLAASLGSPQLSLLWRWTKNLP